MKYLQKYKLFEASSDEYQLKYDDFSKKIRKELINDIIDLMKNKLHVSSLKFPQFRLERYINKNISKSRFGDPEYSSKPSLEEVYVDSIQIYQSEDDILIEWFGNDVEEQEELSVIDINDIIKIYDYLEGISYMDLFEYYIENDYNSEIAELVYGNIAEFDFDDFDRSGKDVLEFLDDDDSDFFIKIKESYYFQKWIAETEDDDKIQWLLDSEVKIDDKLNDDPKYGHLFQSREIGLM